DVVILTFDSEKSDIADRSRLDRSSAMDHLSLGQSVAHKDGIYGLQVELGGQIHDRQIFVIELAMPFGSVSIVADEIHEEILVRRDMALKIHAHEAGKLQETWIDLPADARQRPRHLHDDIVPEPIGALGFRQQI